MELERMREGLLRAGMPAEEFDSWASLDPGGECSEPRAERSEPDPPGKPASASFAAQAAAVYIHADRELQRIVGAQRDALMRQMIDIARARDLATMRRVAAEEGRGLAPDRLFHDSVSEQFSGAIRDVARCPEATLMMLGGGRTAEEAVRRMLLKTARIWARHTDRAHVTLAPTGVPLALERVVHAAEMQARPGLNS